MGVRKRMFAITKAPGLKPHTYHQKNVWWLYERVPGVPFIAWMRVGGHRGTSLYNFRDRMARAFPALRRWTHDNKHGGVVFFSHGNANRVRGRLLTPIPDLDLTKVPIFIMRGAHMEEVPL